MNILITGHRGLIGGALYKALSVKHNVWGVEKGERVNLPEKLDLIIHTGANCVIRETIKNPDLAFRNVSTTYNIMELARRKKSKVILMSSGRVNHDVHNPYTASKRYLEELAKVYCDCYGVEYLIIRPETIWGFSENNERALIKWVQAAIQNKPLVIYGDKEKELSPLHINDFTIVVLFLIKNWEANRTITLTGKTYKVVDIINLIKKLAGSRSKVVWKKAELTQPQKCTNSDYELPDNLEFRLASFISICKLL